MVSITYAYVAKPYLYNGLTKTVESKHKKHKTLNSTYLSHKSQTQKSKGLYTKYIVT